MNSNVRHVLSQKSASTVWTITPEDSVYNAIKLMAEENIGALLVMDGDKIVGIITERDYARKVILQNRSSRTTMVSEVMTRQVCYVEPNDSAPSCMALMTERRLRHLPVLENGALIGMISMGDIVKAIVSDQKFLIDELTRYITGSNHPGPTVSTDKSLEDPACKVLDSSGP